MKKRIEDRNIEVGEIYHVYNRGVEKRNIFTNEGDYFRFIHDLFEFNDKDPAGKFSIPKRKQADGQLSEVRLPTIKSRDKVVDILAYCLMPNHYHLMVRVLKENGLTEFMRKLGTGYVNYFNLKYDRVGTLFQGKFKFVRVSSDAQLKHLPNYIHFNPLDLLFSNWRSEGKLSLSSAFDFLSQYRWSSYMDYIGEKNFPSLIDRKFLTEYLGEPHEYKSEIKNWLECFDFGVTKDIAIEKSDSAANCRKSDFRQ